MILYGKIVMFDIHFFHGFLGETNDWDKVTDSLSQFDCNFTQHSLLSDTEEFTDKTLSFEIWAQKKEKSLQKNKGTKILVAYSLGGRLCLHLDPSCYDCLILFGVHPGLDSQRESRLQRDKDLAQDLLAKPWEQWIDNWNRQEVFQWDKVRPVRNVNKSQKKQLSLILQSFSLGRQSDLAMKIRSCCQKIYWGRGENDKKFAQIDKKWQQLLPSDHLFVINQAGHGVLFDNPKGVAMQIEKTIRTFNVK